MHDSASISPYYIKCYPGLDVFFNSKYVSKIIGKLEFWFSCPKYQSQELPYKFFEPCKHRGYKEGDSWIEELGISRKVFNAAFKLFGMTYISKSAFKAQADPFQGKLYVKYYDRKKNTTYFIRNNAFAEKFFNQFIHATRVKDIPQENNQLIEYNDNNVQKCRSSNVQKCRSSISHKHKHNNLSSKLKKSIKKDPGFEIEEKMKAIWLEEVDECTVIKISSKLAARMQICWENFGKSFEKWREYCQKIASSKFLMGEKEGTKFKALFSWVIEISTIQDIENGKFSMNDRILKSQKQEVKIDTNEMAEENICRLTTTENKVFHKYLLSKGGTQDYHRWFRNLSISVNDAGNVIIKTLSNFMRDTVQNRFYNLIKDAIYHTFKADKPYNMMVQPNRISTNNV